MKYLNLGCGYKYVKSEEWLNADMLPVGEEVVHCNFLDGIPFETGRFDLVYHSHVLEHFTKADGEKFIAECFRILKTGGVARIALPNLELIAKEYLRNLEGAMNGDQDAENNYDWILLEMYDQTVRNQSGGRMFEYFKKDPIPNEEYVISRIGEGARKWISESRNSSSAGKDKPSIISKIVARPVLILKGIRQMFLKSILSRKEYQTFQIGQFRSAGEIHQWMYDRYSLGRLLKMVGFKDIVVRSATTSYIANWAEYALDDTTETASLFIEAIK